MGTKIYNNLPKFLKETDNYKAFKKELKLFLLLQLFTQWKNLYVLCDLPMTSTDLIIQNRITQFKWHYQLVCY